MILFRPLMHGTALQLRMVCLPVTLPMTHDAETCLRRPPHQIMAWVGLERYGYLEDAQRLAYRFLYM